MAKLFPPPLQHPVVEEGGDATIPWTDWFNRLFVGDSGTAWTPTFTSLTTVGTPTITGVYYKLSQNLVYFRVTITPATSTTGTAGVTYINNFPLDIKHDGGCQTVSGVSAADGACVASNDRIYPSGWGVTTVPVTICGTVEAG